MNASAKPRRKRMSNLVWDVKTAWVIAWASRQACCNDFTGCKRKLKKCPTCTARQLIAEVVPGEAVKREPTRRARDRIIERIATAYPCTTIGMLAADLELDLEKVRHHVQALSDEASIEPGFTTDGNDTPWQLTQTARSLRALLADWKSPRFNWPR